MVRPANRFMLSALLYRGEVAEGRVACSCCRRRSSTGIFFAATDLRTMLNAIWLAADDPDRARNEIVEALTAWPRDAFQLRHFSARLGVIEARAAALMILPLESGTA